MKKQPIIVIIFLLPFFVINCNSRENKTNEERKTDDKSQYHDSEMAEGNLWGEVDINNFIQDAAGIDKMQIKAAQIAKERATHEAITGYAETLRADHSHSLKNLEKIANQEGLTLSDSIHADHQKKLEELQTTDTKFNQYFLEMMVGAHKKDIEKYQNAMKRIGDTHPVKPWINDVIPVLQQHQYQAQRLLDDDSIFPTEEKQ